MRLQIRDVFLYVTLLLIGGLTSHLLQTYSSYHPNNTEAIFKKTKNDERVTNKPPHPPNSHIIPIVDNKPQVYTYNATSLHRLYEFCTWTPSYDCAVVDTQFGPMPIYVHTTPPTDRGTVSGALTRTRSWEPLVLTVILAVLKVYPDAGYVDIGSNVGPFSLQAARHGRRVISVDAVTDNILKLCKSVEMNNLSNQITMVVNPMYDSHTSVGLSKFPPNSYENTHLVTNSTVNGNVCGDSGLSQTVTLDDLIPLMSFKTAILKIDVESFEYYVINGGKKFFQTFNVPSIIMEWEHVKKTDKGKELKDIMMAYKYVAFPVQHHFKYSQRDQPMDYSDYMNWTHDVLWIKRQ